MMTRRHILVLGAALTCGVARGAAQPSLANYRFGILVARAPDVYEMSRETTTIPLRLKDTGFRWGVAFDNPGCQMLEWHEIVRLPAPLKEASGFSVLESPRVLRTLPNHGAQTHIVDNFWFDEGDPLGRHTLELHVNGAMRYSVAFDVVADATR